MDERRKEEIIGERIAYLRKKTEIPVKEILNSLNIKRSTYTNWEQGYRAPKKENLIGLAQIFNTSIDFLMGETEEESISQEIIDTIMKGIEEEKFVHNGKPLSPEKAKMLEEVMKAILP